MALYVHARRRIHLAGRRRPRWWLIGVSVATLVATVVWLDPGPAVAVGLLGIALFNTAVGGLEAYWRLYGWRSPDMVEGMRWPPPRALPGETFSLLVPALDEAAVIGGTLRRLLTQNYPHYEIIVSLCAGDEATIAEVRRVMDRDDPHGRIRVVIRSYERSNKPRQLNAALRHCRGSVVGVIDAEDDVSPGLLARVDALFGTGRADVVQGGVQLMTLGRRPGEWFKVHNALEYFFWFTSRMFYQVKCGFVPLAGNTVFIRRSLLLRAGGWPDNLTEDCALGVLLCTRYGARVVAAYEPALATREEVPPTIWDRTRGSLFWQRVRWNQGFLSVLLQGDWWRLPGLRQRLIAGYLLATPFLQAISAVLLPIAFLTMFSLKVPLAVAMLMYAPVLPISITLMAQAVGLREFGRQFRLRAGLRQYLFLFAGSALYQWVLTAAAGYAVVRHLRGNTTWHKTAHGGHHRLPALSPGLS